MGNTINCSTFLRKESGLRASVDGVTKFKEELEEIGKELIAKIQKVVEDKKKKTIQPSDIEEAIKEE